MAVQFDSGAGVPRGWSMMTVLISTVRRASLAALFALAAFASAPALAQDGSAIDDVMMSVVGEENANEQAFAEEIGLPDPENGRGPPDSAHDKAAFGLDNANEARKLRDETGDRSDAARNLGRDASEVRRGAGAQGPPD